MIGGKVVVDARDGWPLTPETVEITAEGKKCLDKKPFSDRPLLRSASPSPPRHPTTSDSSVHPRRVSPASLSYKSSDAMDVSGHEHPEPLSSHPNHQFPWTELKYTAHIHLRSPYPPLTDSRTRYQCHQGGMSTQGCPVVVASHPTHSALPSTPPRTLVGYSFIEPELLQGPQSYTRSL